METWELFKISAKRAANTALKETSDAADIAGLKIRLKALEAKRNDEYEMLGRLDKRYTELGRLTYRQLKTGVSQAERIAPVIENLDKIRLSIKRVEQQIEKTRQMRDERRLRDRALVSELDDIVEEIALEDEDGKDEE